MKENLVNRIETIREEPGCKEEKTGLHEREFIETRRYTLCRKETYGNDGSVSMCNVVDGEGVIISSIDGTFPPFTAHYAETFIIPASVERFILEPLGESCMVLRATVR